MGWEGEFKVCYKMFKCFCVGEVGYATCTESLAEFAVEDGEGSGFGAVAGTHKMKKNFIFVMDTEGDAATKGVVFG